MATIYPFYNGYIQHHVKKPPNVTLIEQRLEVVKQEMHNDLWLMAEDLQ